MGLSRSKSQALSVVIDPCIWELEREGAFQLDGKLIKRAEVAYDDLVNKIVDDEKRSTSVNKTSYALKNARYGRRNPTSRDTSGTGTVNSLSLYLSIYLCIYLTISISLSLTPTHTHTHAHTHTHTHTHTYSHSLKLTPSTSPLGTGTIDIFNNTLKISRSKIVGPWKWWSLFGGCANEDFAQDIARDVLNIR
jgi:hypothetical protein